MIGQGLLESGWLEPVPNTRDGGAVFKDEYILYQPGVVSKKKEMLHPFLRHIEDITWPYGDMKFLFKC